MARINVLNAYPRLSEEFGYGVSCYEPLVQSFGRRTLVEADDNDYQGDSYRLLADGDEPGQVYGLLTFGWGSCSGCDALQSCETVEQLQALADSLQDSILWFASREALKEYIQNHDWEGDWSWHRESAHDFRRKVQEFLDSDLV